VTAAEGIYVALLRGINVGGKNRLPMKALSEVFVQNGCTQVETYIQSGNVVFHATERVARTIPARVSDGILKRFGLQIVVVLRAASELKRATTANPFLKAGTDVASLHVMFLAGHPTAAQIDSLDPLRSPPDAFIARGSEVYLRLPNGAGRSKLTNAYFDARLGTTSTVRNWRTVLKLVEMTTAKSRSS
jgi:uncharacterized protein (DUF1697 family)